MKTSTATADEAALARPKYYEMDGALRANANRAWLLALPIPGLRRCSRQRAAQGSHSCFRFRACPSCSG